MPQINVYTVNHSTPYPKGPTLVPLQYFRGFDLALYRKAWMLKKSPQHFSAIIKSLKTEVKKSCSVVTLDQKLNQHSGCHPQISVTVVKESPLRIVK